MKERLTGAIILVALIVLLVPELLTGPVGMRTAPAAAATAAITAVGEPPLRSYTMPIGAPPTIHANTPEVSPQAPPTASPQVGPPESSTASPAPDAPKASLQGGESAAHPVVQEDRSSASSAGWVVQLGSFASRKNAERLARSLDRRGFRMSVSPARAGARVLWRVRAGPAPSHAGAVHLAARLRALGHRGELLPVR